MFSIVSIIIKNYRAKQLSQLYKRFHALADIGQNFKVEGPARIDNESGDPARIRIGDNCRISAGRLICKKTGIIEIGSYSVLQDDATLNCLEMIKIGSFTGIASGTMILDNNTHAVGVEERILHRIRVASGGEGYPGLGNGSELSVSAPVIIGDGVWIGANASIMKGVTIGEGSIVARGSVVTKDVAPFTIVAGNPARKVKDLPVPQQSVLELAAGILESRLVSRVR